MIEIGLYLLAAEAAETEGAFGFNFDPLETNLVNLVIVIAVLVIFGRRFLGSTLQERREKIERDISEAEKRAQQADAALAEAQQKLTQAQAEIDRLNQEAQETARRTKERILEDNAREVERLKASAVQDLAAERERAIAQIRETIVNSALQRVERQMRENLDESAQHRLVDRSLAQLGGGR